MHIILYNYATDFCIKSVILSLHTHEACTMHMIKIKFFYDIIIIKSIHNWGLLRGIHRLNVIIFQ